MSTSNPGSARGGKRGRLEGASISDEVLDSSSTILSMTRSGALRGLQQFYSPPEAAELIAAVQGRSAPTLDPTAGDGSLLAGVERSARFGVEIDPDQVDRDRYCAIQGDLQVVYPMLRTLAVKVPRIAANPPFGLDWTGIAGKRENSTLATWRMCIGLLHEHGIGAVIAGRDRFRQLVLPREDAAGIYAIVECPDLFEGVELPVLIAFFTHPANLKPGTQRVELTSTRAGLTDLVEQLVQARNEACVSVASGFAVSSTQLRVAFETVERTLQEARSARSSSEARFDVELRGQRVHVRLSPWARVVLAKRGSLQRSIEHLNRQNVAYFALNTKEWTRLADLADEGVLTIDPTLTSTVAQTIQEAARQTCPLYPVRPQQRLAYLDDLDRIRCIKPDDERGFVAGERYSLSTFSEVQTTKQSRVTTTRTGDVTIRKYEEEAKILVVSIDGKRFNERAEDVAYLVEHFDLPDPGDVGTRFPEQVAHNEQVLVDLGEEHGFTHKQFQVRDLARLMVKGSGLLGWEQGLGKSLGGLSLIEASIRNGAKRTALIVCPQDLVEQWQTEARKFLGIEIEHVTTTARARQVARELRAGGEGIYITHFEALSVVGRVDEPLPTATFRYRTSQAVATLDTDEHCPSCVASYQDGWQQRSPHVCRACGYVHKRLVVKPAAHHLAQAFADGVIVVDEGTLIKGSESHRSKAIRGLRARHRYVLSGTPISNYVNDVFWLLWWALGNASAAFPYDYHGGRTKFENDFCVIEHMMGTPDKGTQHRRERRKVLPQVTNVSRLWRLLAGGMVRRRKEDTGEPLVPRTLKTVAVPMGAAQRALYEQWLDKRVFERFFTWKYPDHPLVDAGLVEKWAAGIGQLQKLEYATTLPESDPDHWPALARFEHTNWTPKNLKVVELAIKHAQQGEKVLIGSCLIETGPWICERLREMGINAVHITEERNGRHQTLDPRKRAQQIHEFRYGAAQVLCCGIPSVRLGHNLDTASVVIVDGLVFSYEMFDQFIARAHRLTSTKPVTVYVPIVTGSLDEAKWDLLSKKAQAADLALDGQLITEREEPVPLEKVLRDLQRAGIAPTGNEIAERALQTAWRRSLPTRRTTQPSARRAQTPTRRAPRHSDQNGLFVR